jgi:release factor glutamine methyltransferase
MNILSWLEKAKTKVPSIDAELILLNILREKDRTYLISHDTRDLTEVEEEKANYYLNERAKNKPLAYIINSKEFYGREFYVDENVLIPRPETEDIIDIVKKIAENIDYPIIYDVGTGSGCIATTLKLEIPKAKVVAIDNSDKALEVAKKNSTKFHYDIILRKSDLLNDAPDRNIDIVAANLPYVDKAWDWLDFDSLEYEPLTALYASNDGLALIYELINQVSARPDIKHLILESDPSQHQKIIDYCHKKGLELVETRNFILYFVD